MDRRTVPSEEHIEVVERIEGGGIDGATLDRSIELRFDSFGAGSPWSRRPRMKASRYQA